jgi:cytochrome c oxidase assembly protein Cox11
VVSHTHPNPPSTPSACSPPEVPLLCGALSFCFDEQRLRARETVDMPVFFYIDPKINDDRRCNDVTHLTLSYTFFAMRSDEEEEEEEAKATGEEREEAV